MPASFILTIDLTPPQITWGPVDGAVASELMTVLYLVDEPGVVSAQLQLADGRTLAMTVLADRLTVQLPDDAADGLATVTALLADDVGNEATATLQVPISGEIPAPLPVIETQAYPPEEPIKRWKSRAILRSRYLVIRRRTATTRVRVRVTERVRITATERRTLLRLTGGSVTRVRGAVHSMSQTSPSASWSVAKRAEGPEAESDLLLLGIL